jgi:hypothetical protein
VFADLRDDAVSATAAVSAALSKRKRTPASKSQPTVNDRTGTVEDDDSLDTEIDPSMGGFIDERESISESEQPPSSEPESTQRETSESSVTGADTDSDDRPVW